VVLFGKLGRNKVFILRQENNHDHIKIEYSAKNYINFGNKILTEVLNPVRGAPSTFACASL
ncbi:MAG: hypothetical protein LBR10_09305, partial [Prevotellaceae bacterium]|nr:hypothetical protein [Prevotellaceae bacterium]